MASRRSAAAATKAEDEDTKMADVDAPAEEVDNEEVDDHSKQDEDADAKEDDADADADADGDEDAPADDSMASIGGRTQREVINLIDETSSYVCDYEDKKGRPIAIDFQRLPNKRHIPEYFEIIKEPMAFSTVRSKCLRKGYTKFSEFVYDVARIVHNAQVFNVSTSEIAGNARHVKAVFVKKLQQLVEAGAITAEEAELPDLGEIPADEDNPVDQQAAANGQAAEDGEDDEEEEGSEGDDEDDDDEGRRGRTRTRGSKDDDKDADGALQKRGRPPKVYTPTEARIQALIKGLRRSKTAEGLPHVYHFEKLPDKAANKDYYLAVAQPIALDIIKKKAKRKKYSNLDQVAVDLELMFNNALNYNEPGSDIHNDALALQKHARKLAAQEKAKPDDSFRDEDGKLPLESTDYDGHTWRVGDWVLIRNLNDPQKPIVSQIFRLWQDESGQRWVNACWYYRPEQTVHRVSKRFFNNEIVKTGQYRDHHIEDIVGQCFVMFITRYFRGRPRDFTGDKEKEVYVCEARYNEEKFTFNKIKTWTSCLPDEVREADYVMDMFPQARPQTKEPSPIKHLVKSDAKETDPLPKPTWGNPNAPPIIGAVHVRPREHNDSLSPPPLPPPQPTPAPAARRSFTEAAVSSAAFQSGPTGASSSSAQYGSSQFAPTRPSASFSQSTPSAQTPGQLSGNNYMSQAANGYQSSHSAIGTPYNTQLSQSSASMPQNRAIAQNTNMHGHGGYKPPEPYEVWRVREDVESQIPEDVREQYSRDEQGRVLFFTQPPQYREHPGISDEHASLGHSMRYLADQERNKANAEGEEKAREEAQEEIRQRKLALRKKVDERYGAKAAQDFGNAYARYIRKYNSETERILEGTEYWREEKTAWEQERAQEDTNMKDEPEGEDKWAHYNRYNKLSKRRRTNHSHNYMLPSWVPNSQPVAK